MYMNKISKNNHLDRESEVDPDSDWIQSSAYIWEAFKTL